MVPAKQLVNPLKYLREAVNSRIYVRLKDGSEYVGTLIATDNTMNLILEDAIEVAEGGKKLKAKVGRVLIKGAMVEIISFNPEDAVDVEVLGA